MEPGWGELGRSNRGESLRGRLTVNRKNNPVMKPSRRSGTPPAPETRTASAAPSSSWRFAA